MLNLILLLALVFCETVYAKATNQPKLLWEKEFGQKIRSVAISKNGEVVLALESRIIKMIEDKRYYTDVLPGNKKGVKFIWGGSKLCYLDKKGNVLWEYKVKKMQELSYVSISDDGKYVACSLNEISEREGTYGEEKAIYQEWYGRKILFFNSKGKLLWSFKTIAAKCQISFDGNYIFIIPETDELRQPYDDFYLLNKDGKVLCKILSGERISSYKMTKDAKRILIGNALYDRNGNVLWKLKEGIFTEITEDGSYGIVEIPIYPQEPMRNRWKAFWVVDLNKKEVLWKINADIIKDKDPPYTSIIHVRAFTEYFIDEKNNWLVTLQEERINEEWLRKHGFKINYGEVKIYDLKTGKLIKKSLDASEYYNYKELYQTQSRKYKVEKKENILYYYSLEVTK